MVRVKNHNIASINKIANKLMTDIAILPWSTVDKELEGIALSDWRRLADYFPEDDEYYAPALDTEMTRKFDFLVYSMKPKREGLARLVGYYCRHCDNVMIPPPEILVFERVKPRRNDNLYLYLYYCQNKSCGKYLPMPFQPRQHFIS